MRRLSKSPNTERRKVVQILADGWRSLGVIGTVVGVLYLWPDIRGLPEAYGYDWGQVMPDREIVALVMLALALLWIVWIDVRPTVRRWVDEQKRHPIKIHPTLHCDALFRSKAEEDKGVFLVKTFFLVVGNGHNTGATLKRAQARILHWGEPVVAPLRDSKSFEVDIRHGETAYFEIAQIDASPNPPILESGINYDHNAPRNNLSLTIPENWHSEGIEHDWQANPIFQFLVVISADDVTARSVRVNVDLRDRENLVSWTDAGVASPA